MGILKRAQTIFQAKANDALNKAEDPRQTLDLSYEQQLENLTKVSEPSPTSPPRKSASRSRRNS